MGPEGRSEMTANQRRIDELVNTECERTGVRALMVTCDSDELAFTTTIPGRIDGIEATKMLGMACAGMMHGLDLGKSDIDEYFTVIAEFADHMLGELEQVGNEH